LTWNASACDGGSTISGYVLYRGSQPIANLNATTLNYVDGGLAGGTVYTYHVVAINSVGPSAASTPASAAPLSQNPEALSLLIGLCALRSWPCPVVAVVGRKS